MKKLILYVILAIIVIALVSKLFPLLIVGLVMFFGYKIVKNRL